MPPTLYIRDAHLADLDFLVASNAAMALETERKTLDLAVLERGVAAVFEAPARGFYLIAERHGQSIGCLLITHEWSDWRNGDWWWLQSVYVRHEARRSGVFRALYDEIERRARRTPGVVGLRLYVERENRPAQATYAALHLRDAGYLLLERSLAGGTSS